MSEPRIQIYTDGSCWPNPGGAGGWGVVVLDRGIITELSGGTQNTTNNRMELTAVIEALRALPDPVRVTIFTDSRYVVDCAEGVYGIAANRDLWAVLFALMRVHDVRFRWVKAHAGDVHNERADQLAETARKQFVTGLEMARQLDAEYAAIFGVEL